jgi:hypothetical protein
MNTPLKPNSEFKQWIGNLKSRIRQSQIKAAIKVNEELLHLYWDLGHDIVAWQMDAIWGKGFFSTLSKELMAEFPKLKGFSATNLKYCKYFYQFYSQDFMALQQAVGTLPLSENEKKTIPQHVGDGSQEDVNKSYTIRHQVGDEFDNKNSQYRKALQIAGNECIDGLPQLEDGSQESVNKSCTIRQQVVDEFNNENSHPVIMGSHPIFRIPWRHQVEIFSVCKSVHEAQIQVLNANRRSAEPIFTMLC